MHSRNMIRILSLTLTLVIAIVLGVPSVMAEETGSTSADASSAVQAQSEAAVPAAETDSKSVTPAVSDTKEPVSDDADTDSGSGSASAGVNSPASTDTSEVTVPAGNTDTAGNTGTGTDTGNKAGDTTTDDSAITDNGQAAQPSADTQQTDETSQDTQAAEDAAEASDSSDEASAVPVMDTNLHAGLGFYESQLASSYHISFSGSFSSIMDEIEARYHKGSAEKAMNWQDVLAVYVLQQQKKGIESYTFDDSCKEALARVFVSMNVKQRDKDGNISYTSLTVNDYISSNQDSLSEDDISLLERYVSKDCTLLCAAATSAQGFIQESLGSDVSAERASVVTAAYSLIGKISYFWGGKSTVIGWDSRWGSGEQVAAAGSDDTGSIRAYGLDCSGFISWAYINGYRNASMQNVIGQGTQDQWNKSTAIDESEAQPGDLVFLQIPNDASINHVGIIVGKNDNGDWVVIHCNASDDGVVMQEAYSAGFRYIRSPAYPAQ